MVKWIENNIISSDCSDNLSLMDVDTVKRIQRFHESFPQYSVTPIHSLRGLADKLNVGGIYIKDESHRFGLNSFKALGCTFAIASFIARETGCPVWELDYKTLPGAAKGLGEFTFFAATDGNHGRAVAWAAKKLGQKAVIYMNKGCSPVRLQHIRDEGCQAAMTELNYDDTIRYVKELAAQTPNSTIIQDTAWEGYEQIPSQIMQGYAVMVLEACEQLDKMHVKPTHVILQAGVGAFAGAAQALISNYYGDSAPVTFIVEPHSADCYYRSVKKGDGTPEIVSGEMKTIMAGLACGEPNPVSWDIIKNKSKYFVTIDDSHTEQAMRLLAHPASGDEKIVSGESGAAGMGFLSQLLTAGYLSQLRVKAGINRNSRFMLFSTEGNTDPVTYKQIINNERNGE